MSYHHFLFSYSVSPTDQNSSEKIEKSDKVRKKIAEIDELFWTKEVNVETTFYGEISLKNGDISSRRNEAQSYVKKIIKNVMEENDAFFSVNVEVSLMVDELGERINFSI